MAHLNLSVNTSDMSLNDTLTIVNGRVLVLFKLFISVQVLVASLGVIMNCILFYGQVRTRNWPFYQRFLFLNVTAAATLSTLIHFGQGTYQLHKYISGGHGNLEGGEEWSDWVADIAQTAVLVGMVILALQNLVALRQCDSRLRSAKREESKRSHKIIIILILILLVWLLSVGFVYIGLNPQAQVKDEMAKAASYIRFFIGLGMEVSIACTIYSTRRTLHKLKTDFDIRRAQQNLATRVHIKETVSLTSTITRVLILHVLIWLVSLAIGFGMNRFLTATEGVNEFEEDEGQAALTAMVDVVVLTFDISYPFVLSRNQVKLQRHMRSVISCGVRSKVTDDQNSGRELALPSILIVPSIQSSPQAHFGAIETLWQRVVDAKPKKTPSDACSTRSPAPPPSRNMSKATIHE